ncbi:MAG: signal peptidase I [Sphingomonadaceae bacterium]
MTEITPSPLPETPVPETGPKAKPQKSETKDFLSFLLRLGLIVLIVRSFIFSPFNIPSESMLPRLMIGDYLIVSKWSYGYSKYSLPFSLPLIPGRLFASQPERGDVVVFKAPPTMAQDYIKRVIGLPGDLIEVHDGIVSINGKPILRRRIADFIEPLTPNSACAKLDSVRFRERGSDGKERCRYPRFVETLPEGKSYDVLDLETVGADNTVIYAVPEGHVFLMGDNRDRSADSRFPAVEGQGIGIVPQENLVGRAWFGFFSTDGSASWLLPWTWFSAARWHRIGVGF